MEKKLIFFYIIFLSIGCALIPHKIWILPEVIGVVKEENTDNLIDSCNILVIGLKNSTTLSESNGSFKLLGNQRLKMIKWAGDPLFRQQLMFNADGYLPETTEVSISTGDVYGDTAVVVNIGLIKLKKIEQK